MKMNIHEEYQRENEFLEDEKLYYLLTGEGGAAMISKSHKYYVISCTLIAAYDIEEDKLLKKAGIIRWPISTDDYEKQDATNEYFNTYKDGVIYKVRGRQVINNMGDLSVLYVKEILETDIHGTKLDKKREKYLAPILLEDEVLGHLKLEKDSGLFKGSYSVNGQTITIYVEVEWDQKRTWKKPLAVARDFIVNIGVKDQQAREYAASDEELFENALESLEADCEISFSNPEEFAEALKGRLKYIFVNQNGSYTIGYDDGYVFGGHEIDVDVNVKGMFVCADVR